MSGFKRIPLKIDAATGRQIDEHGSIAREADQFRLLFDETVILCCELYDLDRSSGVAVMNEHPISEDMALAAFGDCDFDPATPFMFLTEQSGDLSSNHVNAPGDWYGGTMADRSKGQISFRINTNTTRFSQALKAPGYPKYYFLITGIPAGETEKSVLAYFQFKAENRPSSSAGEPAGTNPSYLTAQQTLALLNAAPVREYNIDGATLWHSTQTNADRFYRETRLNGEPTAAFPLPRSAYQEWLNSGNTGTEEQFLASLKGEDGIGLNYLGAWRETVYVARDAVTYAGSLYIADGPVSAEPPAEGWTLLVSKGDKGTDGYSAYEIWLALGNDGTEQDFIASLSGSDGSDGSHWLSGTGVPDNSNGNDGDLYLNTNNGDVYKKAAGAWGGAICNIIGPAWDVDAYGLLSGLTDHDAEIAGYSYLATDTGDLYIKNSAASGDWAAPVPFKGDKGDQGDSVNPCGEYSAAATYSKNDLVTLNGSSYVSRTDGNTGNNPAADANNWQLAAEKGADGNTPLFVSGTFANADLNSGILTVTHTNGNAVLPFAITDNNGGNVLLDEQAVTFSNNHITVDLAIFGAISGTWKYAFGGVGTGSGGGGGSGALADMDTVNNDVWSGADLSVVNGGTGASTAANARTNLGLGNAAVLNAGTAANNLVQLTTAGKLPPVDGSLLTNLPVPSGILANPMTSVGDIIVGGAAGIPTRLARGGELSLFCVVGGVPGYHYKFGTSENDIVKRNVSGGIGASIVSETASGGGVTVDGLLIKDGSVSSQYLNKGNIADSVTIDRNYGDYQACTTTGAVTGITIANLRTETGMIVEINNAAGYAVNFGTTTVITPAESGRYACAFYNRNGTVFFMGKGRMWS